MTDWSVKVDRSYSKWKSRMATTELSKGRPGFQGYRQLPAMLKPLTLNQLEKSRHTGVELTDSPNEFHPPHRNSRNPVLVWVKNTSPRTWRTWPGKRRRKWKHIIWYLQSKEIIFYPGGLQIVCMTTTTKREIKKRCSISSIKGKG